MKRIVDVLRSLGRIRDTKDGELMHYITEKDGMRYANKMIVNDSRVTIEEGYEETEETIDEYKKRNDITDVGDIVCQSVCLTRLELLHTKLLGHDIVKEQVERMYIGIMQFLVVKEKQPISKVRYYTRNKKDKFYIYAYILTKYPNN